MALALAGCAPGGENIDGSAAVELGTGEIEFEPIEPGQDLDVIQGPQGGFHVLGSLRARGLEPGDRENLDEPNNPHVLFCLLIAGDSWNLLRGDGSRVSEYDQGLEEPLDTSGGWSHEMVGRQVVLDIGADDEAVGNDAVLEVVITDANGVEVRDERDVHLVAWPFND